MEGAAEPAAAAAPSERRQDDSQGSASTTAGAAAATANGHAPAPSDGPISATKMRVAAAVALSAAAVRQTRLCALPVLLGPSDAALHL